MKPLLTALLIGAQIASAAVTNIDNAVRSNLIQVSVKTYGAYGNGSSNDTAAIQSAIDSGYNVFFPPGMYKLTSSLIATNSNQQITAGPGTTLQQTHATSNVFCFVGASNVTLRGLRLVMAGTWSRQYTSPIGTMDTALFMTNCPRAIVDSLTVSNANYVGIAMVSCPDFIVRDCTVEGCPAASRGYNEYAKIIESSDVLVYGISPRGRIANNRLTSGGAIGVYLPAYYTTTGSLTNSSDVLTDIVIEGNIISDHTRMGVFAYRSTTVGPNATCERLTVRDNLIMDCYGLIPDALGAPPAGVGGTNSYGHGISINRFEDSSVTGNTISNVCLFTRRTLVFPSAITMANVSWFTISGNRIFRAHTDGIYCNNVGTQGRPEGEAKITDNYLYNIGRTTNLFSIEAGSTNVSLTWTNYLVGDQITWAGAGAGGGNLSATITSKTGDYAYGLDTPAETSVTNGAAVSGAGTAIRVVSISKMLVANNVVADSYPYGMTISYCGPGVVIGNQVQGSLTDYGFTFTGNTKLVATGNSAYSSYAYGFGFAGLNKRVSAHGNIVYGATNGFQFAATDTDILLGANVIDTCAIGVLNIGTTNIVAIADDVVSSVTTRYSGPARIHASGPGEPAFTNLVGSLWLRTDGSSTNDVLYIGLGGTNWVSK